MINEKIISKTISKLSKKVAGISTIIFENGELLYSNYTGYIDEKHTKNNKEAMMMIGSNGKVITAIAIMQLFEKGLIDLDADVQLYLKDLDIQSRFEHNTITTRTLLMHRSGLASDDFHLITNHLPFASIINVINKTPLSNPPGTMYAYSNLGYGLLGLLVERISGLDFEEYVKRNIFDPLESNFVYLKTDVERNNYNLPISACFDSKLQLQKEPLTTITPAGIDLFGSMEDMIKLMRVFLDDDPKVLQKSTVRLMLNKPHIEQYIEGEIMHGLGLIFGMYNYFSVEIGNIINHGGDTKYHHSRLAIIPKMNAGFIVMTNTESGLTASLKILKTVMDEYFLSKNVQYHRNNFSDIVTKQQYISEAIEGTYVGPRIKTTIYKTDEILYANIRSFKMKLLKDNDGFYSCIPIGITKLPVIRNMIIGLKLCIRKASDQKMLLYAHETSKNSYNTALIGIKHQNQNTSNLAPYIGKYTLINEDIITSSNINNLHFNAFDDTITISIEILGSKQLFYLMKTNETMYTVQSVGRYSGDTLEIQTKNGQHFIHFLGLQFSKNE